jgi:hypothetical protein
MSTIFTVVKTTTYGAWAYNPYIESVVLKAFRSLADAEAFESDCYKTNKPLPGNIVEFSVDEVEFEE